MTTFSPYSPALASIDLFAGAGGLSEGLRQAGFSPVYANEVIPAYAQTYALNHPETLVDSRDIRDVDAGKIRAELGLQPGELALLAGGPPCQGFSINAPSRSAADRRNHLVFDYLRFVEEFQPRSVLIENVPGMVSFGGGATLEAILAQLRELGYEADVRILYAPHYGVPQMRWRTVIIGARGFDPLDAFPVPVHNAPARVNFTAQLGPRNLVWLPTATDLLRNTTVGDAIGDLPVLANGERGDAVKKYRRKASHWFQSEMREGAAGVTHHEAPRLTQINLDRLSHIPAGGNWTDIPFDLLPKGMKLARRSDHTKRYGRSRPDALSSTILTKCDPHWGAYFHYDQDRAFTVREAARIQSFPDRYAFTGARVAQYEQVGNAVPPLLARAVGQSILAALRGADASSALAASG